MIWQDDPEEEQPEATWEEYSVLYKHFSQYLTFSEFDQIEKPVMLKSSCDVEKREDGGENIVYFSNYSIYTHKGDLSLTLSLIYPPTRRILIPATDLPV